MKSSLEEKRFKMLTIKNVKNFDGKIADYTFASPQESSLDAEGRLTLFPALIDSHVHLWPTIRNGQEQWRSLARAAIKGGITTLFNLPVNHPITNLASFKQVTSFIYKQLDEIEVPLRYHLYAGADPSLLEELGPIKKLIKGIVLSRKIQQSPFLLHEKILNRLFELAAMDDLIVVIDAKEGDLLRDQMDKTFSSLETLNTALLYTEKYAGRLYVLNVSTKEELELIQDFRQRGVLIYVETTPQFLFSEDTSQTENQQMLWKAFHEGVIDMVGSGYLNGTDDRSEIKLTYLLPSLLNAYHEKKLSLEKIIQMTRINIERVLEIEGQSDLILVDLEKEQSINLNGLGRKTLKGWPVYTIVQGRIFDIQAIENILKQ